MITKSFHMPQRIPPALRIWMAAGLLLMIAGLSLWLWLYGAYVCTEQRIAEAYDTGNLVSAKQVLDEFQAGVAWGLIERLPMFERLRHRVSYSAGVIETGLGMGQEAQDAFEAAVLSAELPVASAAHYNLALLNLNNSDQEGAKMHLRRALALMPGDTQSQVNLELLLRSLRAQNPDPHGSQKEKQSAQSPTEQWRNVPNYESTADMGPKRSYK